MGNLLRTLDPGRVRLRVAMRTIIAAVAALLATWEVTRAAGLPGGMTVIATVVAVMVSRTLHGTSLAHQLSALAYVPAIGVLAAFTGRYMIQHPVPGATLYVGAVWASRYLLRFGGTVRRLGRLALTPLISVLVVPIPPSAAEATGPVWGGAAGLIAVLCVVAVKAVTPANPAREAATAAGDFLRIAASMRVLPPGSRRHARTARALHRAALTVEDRLDAALVPDRGPLDALSTALLRAEVRAAAHCSRPGVSGPAAAKAAGDADAAPEVAAVPEEAATDAALKAAEGAALDAALEEVRSRARVLLDLRAREAAAPEAPAARRRPGGWRDPQPHTRLSLQMAAAMGAAFAAGHLVLHHRWTWTMITAFVVCGAARSRGDVVHRSGLRVGGAVAGALTGTLVAHLVSGVPVLAVTVIFACLLVGLWLRDLNYAVWAFCVTSVLAVLYTLDGERGAALLVQRPEGILLGSACGIAAAYFVLPLRTETVMRGRAARVLHALQELVGAARAPEPEPAAVHRLARALDRATRDLGDAAAPARAHRYLARGRADRTPFPRLTHRPAARAVSRPPTGPASAASAPTATDPTAPAPASPAPLPASPPTSHAADWADAVAACAHAARALGAATAAELADARSHLGLTALNVGLVRRRLGHRPDAAPPRPARTGPPYLIRLNACLADLYERLPAPSAPAPATSSAAAPATTAG